MCHYMLVKLCLLREATFSNMSRLMTDKSFDVYYSCDDVLQMQQISDGRMKRIMKGADVNMPLSKWSVDYHRWGWLMFKLCQLHAPNLRL
jgi:hypothetical protein